MTTTSGEGTRLNKYISETGLCSRREADRIIADGKVLVNGEVAEMGLRVGPDDEVLVKGKPLRARPEAVYLAYHKPVGITCTTDPAIAGNIVDAVKYPGGRIFPIGRLDKPSEGLILLTNDGDIVNKILRAGNAHEKEYNVTVDRAFGSDFVQRMAAGVPILDTVTQPCRVHQTSPVSFNIVLTQGLNRQIRRMSEALGYNVVRLKRVRVMNIRLDGLKAGQWRPLNRAEMDRINAMVADSSKTEEASSLSRPSTGTNTPGPGNKAPRQDKPPSSGARQSRERPRPASAPRQRKARNGTGRHRNGGSAGGTAR